LPDKYACSTVEVTQFAHEASKRFLESLGCVPTLRPTKTGHPFITDNNNFIYDCKFPGINNPADLNQRLAARPGIVESGLFLGLAEIAIVADEKGVRILTRVNQTTK
jgi:ribose 5-phosphate isomerase A